MTLASDNGVTHLPGGGRKWRADGAVEVLLERAGELDLIRRMITDLDTGHSAMAIVEGAPGSGRSALLAEIGELASANGIHVATAQGSPTESALHCGVIIQVLRGVFPLDHPLWTRPEWTEPDGEAELLQLLCRELLAAARRVPIVVLVDDVHHADPLSMRWLGVVTRARGGPVLLVVSTVTTALRPGSFCTTGQRPPNRRVEANVRKVTLAPLSGDGVADVLGAVSAVPVRTGFAEAVTKITGGNPALIAAVLRHFARLDCEPSTEHLAELELSTARAVGEQVRALMSVLPEELVGLLGALAVCGTSLPLNEICALAGLRTRSAADALHQLTGVGLVRQDPVPRLVNAVTAESVLAAMPREQRENLHAEAADLGYRMAIADLEVARMLLGARPIGRPWAVEVLRRAASEHQQGGRQAEAAQLLERALAEPLEPAARARVLLELGTVEFALAPEVGARHLGQVISGAADPGQRVLAADHLVLRGESLLAQRSLAQAISGGTPELGRLVAMHWLAEATHLSEQVGLAALATVPQLPSEPRDRTEAGVLAWKVGCLGKDLARTQELATRALSPGGDTTEPLAPSIQAVRALALAGDFDTALTGLDRILLEARRRGVAGPQALTLIVRSGVEFVAGRLDEANRSFASAVATQSLRDWHPMLAPGVVAVEALLALEDGAVERAEAVIARFVTDMPSRANEGIPWTHLLYARGCVRLRGGDARGALDDLVECGRHLLAKQIANPLVVPWRGVAASAHRERGDTAAAERLLIEDAELLRAWGAPPRRKSGITTLEPVERVDGRPLTASENRIAWLAAQGWANAAIAGEIGVNVRTVELRLSRLYRKLGIGGKAELRDALARSEREF
ncbi:AAA family ATPase [Allokutzneria multivorans]|uniref:AAA family ATPase n=1 Tax=Allokutzneria multivorans TaxID=1142134 RepID=A0ABP7SH64_9PSEU